MSTHFGQVIFRDELRALLAPLMEHVGLETKDLHSMTVYRDRIEFDLLGINELTFVHVRVTDRPAEPTPFVDKIRDPGIRSPESEPGDG
jgi:hypothetical protein